MATDLYQALIRPLIFSGLNLDPEWAHLKALQILNWVGNSSQAEEARNWIEQICCVDNECLSQAIWGMQFRNPIGLAAGFDKDGMAIRMWQRLGFGFAELGTVTQHAQLGNPRPRLFRLKFDQAVLNRMGFNNAGAAALSNRLASLYAEQTLAIPIGINLGKSKVTPLDEAVSDYLASFNQLKALGDYFVVNVSSPNTPGLRSLQTTENLKPILTALQEVNDAQKPIFVKIAPDLDWETISALTELAQACQLSGIIATNTTIARDGLTTRKVRATGNPIEQEAGGISGRPLRQRSTEVIRFIYQHTQGKLPIIGVGGVFTTDDAWEKITAGASLIQTYTGWIYEGPLMVKRIVEGLQQKLDEHKLAHISHAVGINTH